MDFIHLNSIGWTEKNLAIVPGPLLKTWILIWIRWIWIRTGDTDITIDAFLHDMVL